MAFDRADARAIRFDLERATPQLDADALPRERERC